jgi:septal ring factor EnvC (AmiA/AmiB activator)
LLGEIRESLRRKQALAADARARADELGEVETRQREQHARLLAQREQRKATLAKISAQISAQRREIGNLQRNEKRLSQLVERLARIIAARPKPRPQESAPQRSTRPEIANQHAPEALPAGRFAQLKGSLRLPVRGTLANRFGTARQEGSTWKGLFIRAATGSEVKAIAGGRVVFADWMRGFGNLLIVDHGDGYLSIYGNNDALLKQVGDAVRGGDDVAAVGNSGGNPESGLYFELRHQGQPLDPLKWVNLK